MTTSQSHKDFLSDPFENESVSEFYNGKSIFLTGGTGFIGKVLVEKLLRACPGLVNIYFLIRPKKGMTCEERLDKIFTMPLFSKLQEINPDAKKKLILCPGDIIHQGLGLSDADRKKITKNCQVIIHSAAAVRFDEPIRVAMEMNCVAVRQILKLVREVETLEVFCHISTAYSQCNRDELIVEKFYPAPIKADKLIEAMEWMSDDMLDAFTKPLIGNYPNTYTFTKAISESMLEEEASDLPLFIIRPSIVCASINDPVPGWIDNYNGVIGIIVAVGKGILRTLLVPGHKNDLVPVDLVSNCILVGVWYFAQTKPSKVLICNCTSGNVNPTTFLDMEKTCQEMMWEYPLNSFFRRPNFKFTGKRIIHQYWQVVSHYIPAIIADGLSLLMGSKPRFMNIYKNINKSVKTLSFFMNKEWNWDNAEYTRMLKAIPNEDRENFDFDMRKIDWKSYYEGLTLGVKVYVLKEDMNELPKAKRLMQRYKLVRWCSTMILVMLSGRYLFLKSERFRKLWFEALFGIYRFLSYLKIASKMST